MTRDEMNLLLSSIKVGDLILVPVDSKGMPCGNVYAGIAEFTDCDRDETFLVDEMRDDYFRASLGSLTWCWDRHITEDQWDKVRWCLASCIQFSDEDISSDDFQEDQ